MNNLICRITPRKARKGKPFEVRFGDCNDKDNYLHWNGTESQAWLLHAQIDAFKQDKRLGGAVTIHRATLKARWEAITGKVPNAELLMNIIERYNTSLCYRLGHK